MRIKSFLLLLLCLSGLITVTGHPIIFNDNCAAPDSLNAVVNGTTASLSWSPVTGATGYWIEIESENATPSFEVELFLTTNTYEATGLAVSGNYKFKVRAKCSNGKGNWAEWHSFFTGTGGGSSGGGGNSGGGNSSCDVPSGLAASSISGDSVTLTWTAVTGATGYWLEVESENTSPEFHLEVFSSTNTYTVTGLSGNVFYKFKVRTVCSNGYSDWSGWVFLVSGSGSGSGNCQSPAAIVVTGVSDSTATFMWDAVTGATGYQIEVEDASGNPTQFHDTATVTTNTYTVTNLLPGLNYKVKVRTLCAGGSKSLWSVWAYFNSSTGQIFPPSTGGGCSRPTGLTTSGVTPTAAVLSWTKVTGALSYVIEVEKESGAHQEFHLMSTDTFISVAGLVPNALYKFNVRTICTNGHSKWSSRKFFVTPPMFSPGTEDRSAETSVTTTDLHIFPNPASNWLTVDLQGAQDGTTNYFSLLDITGKTILEQSVKSGGGALQLRLDLSNCTNGIYLLRWTSGEERLVRKVVVNR